MCGFRLVQIVGRSCIIQNVRAYQKMSCDTINPHVVKLQYAVRGPIVLRALELEKEISQGSKKRFNKIIRCNIGDCHASGQRPISFIREVLCAATKTQIMDTNLVQDDAKLRARRFLDSCGGSVGVYSQSTGVEVVREDVAQYIEQRDQLSANPQNIFLSNGASEAVKSILQLISTGEDGSRRSGVMVPIPQYPLYSATNAEYNAYQIDYYLDESNGWDLSIEQLEEALNKCKDKCIPRHNYKRFKIRLQTLVVLADEVYQHNIYAPDTGFISFKRALYDIGGRISTELQLASFMSCSKGYMGECGLRGGYCELVNFPEDVQQQLYKSLSARLCSSLLGQLTMDVVVNPPKPHEPSYNSFMEEKSSVLEELKQKAELTTKSLNSLQGFSCNPITGAMYAFPRIDLPKKAIEIAKSKGMQPDFMYCLELLEEYGVCVVPGSGFGQVPGTWHFRITILPSIEEMKLVMDYLKEFHTSFLAKYS
ncbi:LOW QUALITY PROTEIN: alanine aminotransferase, putative [Schistosoma mansoni]|uniref:alanine aminotransferase, putative n=1 Tax=Schistosoma mansoni TaxID=6183 RepID=UPI00022C8273|nr:LOW QUALITY PROTEIN: alanine aminotransferase, putative [Schistosoma mansoni]|eukprot:XP_018646383.1 LOW QUALITY PROTEIN: alanine aminotransferase, putative [Schistosoma mansoni]